MGFFGKKIDIWEAQRDVNNSLTHKILNVGLKIDLLEREIESLKNNDETFIKLTKEAEERFSSYYKPLSDKVDIIIAQKTKQSIGKLAIKEPVSGGMTTTDAIIKALKKSGNKLHCKQIFDIIKNYKLINQDVAFDTVKATLYSLVKRKKIESGKKPGTFFIKEK